MALATLETSRVVVAEPITPANFAAYGGVISSAHQLGDEAGSSANYGTARKQFRVSPVANEYARAPSGQPATANWNLFRCTPPAHLIRDHTGEDGGQTYTSTVLERHPYSTQTFVPMGRARSDVAYMVIVAPSDDSPQRLPAVDRCEAFTVRGDQAVTYGAGTWHAPMIALGDVVDFAVLIHENGVGAEDCEEVYLRTLAVEFTTADLATAPGPQRKPQPAAEFDAQRAAYTRDGGPPRVRAGLGGSGDARFDSKQVKYEAERLFYARRWDDAVALVDAHAAGVEPKIAAELAHLRARAVVRRDADAAA